MKKANLVLKKGNQSSKELKKLLKDPLVRRFYRFVKSNDLREKAYELIVNRLS